MSKPPIAENVAQGAFGPECADCHGVVYADKIERGPRIGTRITYRHIEQRPWCKREAGR